MVSLTGASGVSVPPTGVNGGLGPGHFGRNGVCPQKQLLASEAGTSEECEGLSTGSWNETMDHSLCAWCQLLGRSTCLYLPQIMCVGYVGSLANLPQDQPVSEGPVGSVRGHRVWAGVAAGQVPVPGQYLGGPVNVQVLVNPDWCICVCDLQKTSENN